MHPGVLGDDDNEQDEYANCARRITTLIFGDADVNGGETRSDWEGYLRSTRWQSFAAISAGTGPVPVPPPPPPPPPPPAPALPPPIPLLAPPPATHCHMGERRGARKRHDGDGDGDGGGAGGGSGRHGRSSVKKTKNPQAKRGTNQRQLRSSTRQQTIGQSNIHGPLSNSQQIQSNSGDPRGSYGKFATRPNETDNSTPEGACLIDSSQLRRRNCPSTVTSGALELSEGSSTNNDGTNNELQQWNNFLGQQTDQISETVPSSEENVAQVQNAGLPPFQENGLSSISRPTDLGSARGRGRRRHTGILRNSTSVSTDSNSDVALDLSTRSNRRETPVNHADYLKKPTLTASDSYEAVDLSMKGKTLDTEFGAGSGSNEYRNVGGSGGHDERNSGAVKIERTDPSEVSAMDTDALQSERTQTTEMPVEQDDSGSNCVYVNHETLEESPNREIPRTYASYNAVGSFETEKMDTGDANTVVVHTEVNNNNIQMRGNHYGEAHSSDSNMSTATAANHRTSQAVVPRIPPSSFTNRRVRFAPYVHPTPLRRLYDVNQSQALSGGRNSQLHHQTPFQTQHNQPNIHHPEQYGTWQYIRQSHPQILVHNQFPFGYPNETVHQSQNQTQSWNQFFPRNWNQPYYEPVSHVGNQNVPNWNRVNSLVGRQYGGYAANMSDGSFHSQPLLPGNVRNMANHFRPPFQPPFQPPMVQENATPPFSQPGINSSPTVSSMLAASYVRNGMRPSHNSSVRVQQSTRYMPTYTSFPDPSPPPAANNGSSSADYQSGFCPLQILGSYGSVVTIPGNSSTNSQNMPRPEVMAANFLDSNYIPRVSLNLNVAPSAHSNPQSSERARVFPYGTRVRRPCRCMVGRSSNAVSQPPLRAVPLGLNSRNPSLLMTTNNSGVSMGELAAWLHLPLAERMRQMQRSVTARSSIQSAIADCIQNINNRNSTQNNSLTEWVNQNSQSAVAQQIKNLNELNESDEDDEDGVEDNEDDGEDNDKHTDEDEDEDKNEGIVLGEPNPSEEEMENEESETDDMEPSQNLESGEESDTNDTSFYHGASGISGVSTSALVVPNPSVSATSGPSTSSSSLNTSVVEEPNPRSFRGAARRRRVRRRNQQNTALVPLAHSQMTSSSSGNYRANPQTLVYTVVEVAQNETSAEEASVLGMLPAGYRESDDVLFVQRQMEATLDFETLPTPEEQEWINTHHPPPHPLPMPFENPPGSRPYLTGNSSLLAALECPVCFVYMVKGMPILLCVNGHNVCGYCKRRVHTCPICRGRLLVTRNLALEAIASDVVFHVPSAEQNQANEGQQDSNEASENSTEEQQGNGENSGNQDSLTE